MKLSLSALIISILILFIAAPAADAQFMTDDLFTLKGGYIPYGIVTYDKGIKYKGEKFPDVKIGDIQTSPVNFAVQAEYNIIFGIFWLGLGIEYQRITADNFAIEDAGFEKFNNDFIMPVISFKFNLYQGFYTGVSATGKYLLSVENSIMEGTEYFPTKVKFDKQLDLWANYIIGYNLPVAESMSVIFEGRFGYNVTNKQYSKITILNSGGIESKKYELIPKQSYDSAV
ncbi:MAG: hypothetical protein MUC95_06685, partial [Spirochaetes bacterium]|nr:hypothetical protein [Spirochaetota bacterium]